MRNARARTTASRLTAASWFLTGLMVAGCASTAATTSAAQPRDLRTYAATSELIRVMGRHVTEHDAVAFGASGVTFYIRFRGSALDVELEEQLQDTSRHNWFTVVIDEGEPSRFRTDSHTRRYSLARDLPRGEHTLALSKATEGQNGRERLVAVRAEELLQADALPVRRIEVIGNSITAGFGLDPRPVACGRGTWYDATHAWLAYGPRVARRVNAQWMLSSVSGIGMVRNWNSLSPVMPDIYRGIYMEYADSLTSWDFRRYIPDLLVIALGTNDFSDGGGATPRPALDGDAFVREYTRFVAGVRTRYPTARLMLLSSPMLSVARDQQLREYLRRVIANRAAVGDTAITMHSFAGRYVSGCDGHPSLAEQAKMADELEPKVRSWMGW